MGSWCRWTLAACLLLPGCREPVAEATPIDSSNPIEQAAREANLVEDPESSPPTGLYERRHASGRDAICMAATDDDDAFKFGIIASFGTSLMCQGAGTAVQDGDSLTLRFDDADCRIDAVYDGRSIRLAGAVPASCAALCGPRASLSGVGVSRVGWSDADALTLVSRREVDRGLALCGAR